MRELAGRELRVRAASDALSAAGNSASGPSAARSSAGGGVRGGAQTGACVLSMVFDRRFNLVNMNSTGTGTRPYRVHKRTAVAHSHSFFRSQTKFF